VLREGAGDDSSALAIVSGVIISGVFEEDEEIVEKGVSEPD
jgi:hypothetical protein